LVEEKRKGKPVAAGGKGQASPTSIDTLYSLFLNHLLRPREWNP
jgi:protein phosphatase